MTSNGNGCTKSIDSSCVECSANMHLENGDCKTNDKTCIIQQRNKCLQCTNKEHVIVEGVCKDKNEINCLTIDNAKCKACPEGRYKDIDGCQILSNSIYENCTIPKTSSEECFECEDGYELNEGNCYEIDEDTMIKTSPEVEEDNFHILNHSFDDILLYLDMSFHC